MLMETSPTAPSAEKAPDAGSPAHPGGEPVRQARRWWLALLGVTALAAVSLAAFVWHGRAGAAKEYVAVAADTGTVAPTVVASGTVNPVTTIQVGTYVSGVIQTLSCDFNTRVRAGQLCAKIDPRPYQTAVDQEAANLATARAQLEKDRANLAFSKLIYERDSDLLKRNIVSQETVDTASNAYAQARRRRDHQAAPGGSRRSAHQPGLHQHRLAGRRDGGIAQCDSGANSRRELPDADAVPGRNRFDHHAGRHQCLRERHRRDQTRRQGVLHRRILPQPRLQRQSDGGAAVTPDHPERRHL
jgi:multidrug efflux pump subunit AcrA (membrane-fusion protein)